MGNREKKHYCYRGLCLLAFLGYSSAKAQEFTMLYKDKVQEQTYSGSQFFLNIPSTITTLKHNQLVVNRSITSQPQFAEKLAVNSYLLSKEIHYYPGMASTLSSLALLQRNRGNFDSALTLYKMAIPLTLLAGSQNQIHVIYINIGTIMGLQGNYEQALHYYYQALSAINTYGLQIKHDDSTHLLCRVTQIWHILGETKKSLETLASLKKIVFNNPSKQSNQSLADYYIIACTVNPHLKDSQKLDYHWKVVQLTRQDNNIEILIPALNNLCEFYIEKQQLDSAKIYLNDALEVIKRNPGLNTYFRLSTYHKLGLLLKAEKKYSQAEQAASKTYKEAQSLNFTDLAMDIAPDLAEIYSLTGKPGIAYELMKHYTATQKMVMQQQKTRSVDNWNKARMAEKDQQLLKKQLYISVQDGQLQRKNFWIMTITLGALFIFSAFTAFLLGYRSKQRLQKATMAQLRHVQQIDQLKAQVRGEENERNRIAVDLHDGIASQLWAIKLHVDNLLQDRDRQADQHQNLQVIYRHLDEATNDIRKTAHNLMPGLLLEEGLSNALAKLCKKTQKSTNLEVDFLQYGSIPKLDMEIQLALYRMVQELVQNVLKHAQATALLVQLSCVETLFTITVEDNGIGFNTKDNDNELGLNNIQKRVEAFDGHFDIKSAPENGTTVYMEFDIKHLL